MPVTSAVKFQCNACGEVAMFELHHDAEKAEWVKYTTVGEDGECETLAICPVCSDAIYRAVRKQRNNE